MDFTECFGLIITLGVTGFIIYLVFHTGAVHDDFKKNGIKTEAVVTKFRQIGSSGAGSPKCIFSLRFFTKNNTEINTDHTEFVSVLDLNVLKRERKVEIYYKESDPKKVWMILSEEKQLGL
ncbi:hypothetical protein ACU9CR_004121 [Cronobacter dublinensis]